MTRTIEQLSDISHNYDALFVDLWGCLHNGVTAFPEAVNALRQYRAGGGKVILVTNSPRTREGVSKQILHFKVPEDCWDSIATSGDSARAAMYRGVVGRKVWHIGLPSDLKFFEPPKVVEEPMEIERVDLEDAEGMVCTGPFDSLADPAVMRPQFLFAKQRGLKLLCANPDIVVDRGDVREWCAGALAQLYTEMGGESLYFGKPHPPIYDLARRRLVGLGVDVSDSRILAIGDGVLTDVAGAMGEDIDCLFITGGLAAEETKTLRQPDAEALGAYLLQHKVSPQYAIGFLR